MSIIMMVYKITMMTIIYNAHIYKGVHGPKNTLVRIDPSSGSEGGHEPFLGQAD